MEYRDNSHFLFCRLTGVKLPKKKTAIGRHVSCKRFQQRFQKSKFFVMQCWLSRKRPRLKRLRVRRKSSSRKWKNNRLKMILRRKRQKRRKRKLPSRSRTARMESPARKSRRTRRPRRPKKFRKATKARRDRRARKVRRIRRTRKARKARRKAKVGSDILI